MLKIFKYFLEKAEEVVLRVHQNELWVQLGCLYVSMKFESLSDDYKDSFIDGDEIEWGLLTEKAIVGVNVCCARELYDENDESEPLLNFSFAGLKIMQSLNEQFQNPITGYEVGDYCIDESAYCGDVWNYGVRVSVSKEYWCDLSFYKYIVETIDVEAEQWLDTLATYPQVNDYDNLEVSIVGTNIKCRRLGYLKLLVRMLGEKSQVPQTRLLAEFERYCQTYNQGLSKHRDDKGVVGITKSGNSALPYVEVAMSLELIQKTNSYYVLGKTGKVYEILMASDSMAEYVFEMSEFDKIILTERLLQKDYLYFSTLLELLFVLSGKTYQTVKDVFQDALLSKLEMLVVAARNVDKERVVTLKAIKQRIENWQKPEMYLDHILLPRLNWLYDLGIVCRAENCGYELTSSGKMFLMMLMRWQDAHRHVLANVNDDLNTSGNQLLALLLEKKTDAMIFKSEYHRDILKKYIEASFEKLKTIAPNRVTYSQCASYVCSKMLVEQGVNLEKKQFYSILESGDMSEYLFMYQSFYKDGYIQKTKY